MRQILAEILNGTFVLVDQHQAIVELMSQGLITKYIGKNQFIITAAGCRLLYDQEYGIQDQGI